MHYRPIVYTGAMTNSESVTAQKFNDTLRATIEKSRRDRAIRREASIIIDSMADAQYFMRRVASVYIPLRVMKAHAYEVATAAYDAAELRKHEENTRMSWCE